jgi:hypothetical protein
MLPRSIDRSGARKSRGINQRDDDLGLLLLEPRLDCHFSCRLKAREQEHTYTTMSYQLPPNLLRLFQPRPQLPFAVVSKKDRDPRRPPPSRKSSEPPSRLEGVGHILEQLKQDAIDKGEATMDVEALEGKDEEGKEFTLAEQTKRELRREEKKKAYETNKARQLAEC